MYTDILHATKSEFIEHAK